MKSMTGIELKQLRDQAKLSQQQLAHKLFCAVSSVQKWEQGVYPINAFTANAIRATLK